ncbi:hypothetical protein PC9H_010886 [Pleurotus ostreatus]|uniref:Uncharacterized protein n=1 Tax=Pleurotus ostreatus TaxID=5322 RepID=A0A8H7DP19_PLEOS|nr:uncharacterized protein PC9H_010886 [Pleurotus ostreatus]KAF7422729.1 hypothetical protein PC9H_010886 [Pleurotus ostreatus]
MPNDNPSNDKPNKGDKGLERAGDFYDRVDGRGGNTGGRANHNHIYNTKETSFQERLRIIKGTLPYTDKAAAHQALGELFGMKEPIEEMRKLRNALEAQIEQDMKDMNE